MTDQPDLGQRLQTLFGKTTYLTGTVTYADGPYRFIFQAADFQDEIRAVVTPKHLAFHDVGGDVLEHFDTLEDVFAHLNAQVRRSAGLHVPGSTHLFLDQQVRFDQTGPSVAISSGFHVREADLHQGDLVLALNYYTDFDYIRYTQSLIFERFQRHLDAFRTDHEKT